MEATKVSIDGWMDKEDMIYTYNKILLSHKKEWDLAICDMGGAWGHYAKWNKSDENKHHTVPLICGI